MTDWPLPGKSGEMPGGVGGARAALDVSYAWLGEPGAREGLSALSTSARNPSI